MSHASSMTPPLARSSPTLTLPFASVRGVPMATNQRQTATVTITEAIWRNRTNPLGRKGRLYTLCLTQRTPSANALIRYRLRARLRSAALFAAEIRFEDALACESA